MRLPKVGVVVDYITENKWETEVILKELKARDLKCKLINIYKVPLPVEEHDYGVNVALARTKTATPYRVEALKRLEIAGVNVINSPNSIRLGGNKFESLCVMHHAKIPIPESYMVNSFESAIKAISKIGTPVVLKPVIGTYGTGISRLIDLESDIGTLDELIYPYIVQEYIPHERGDFRVYVTGEKALGAMRRIPPDGEWRTNVSAGGKAEKVRLTKKMADLAVIATREIGAKYAGVDIMLKGRGYVVIEVNTQPDFKGFYRATGINPVKNIVDLLFE